MSQHSPSLMQTLASWLLAASIGAAAGTALAHASGLVRSIAPGAGHAAPDVPLWLSAPFAILLASIALGPLLAPKLWHKYYPHVALFLGALAITCVVVAFDSWGAHKALHAAQEYYAFMALVGGLYVVSGGILIDIRTRATPARNLALLAVGAVLANFVGTTGASVLLIRPLLRTNEGRLRPFHVIFFIFIVSNCGGALTPVGDPPLYLGFLQGVPFFWTLIHLWPSWLLVNGLLLAVFFVLDRRVPFVPQVVDRYAPGLRAFDPSGRTPLIRGGLSVLALVLLVAASLFDATIGARLGIDHLPVGATLQILIACAAFALSPASISHANRFTFEPVKEVGLLFAGIFMTMTPALAYLNAHAGELGLSSSTHFYFAAGALSSVLDNAPTYLSFLFVELGLTHHEPTPAGVLALLADAGGAGVVAAISMGAVFFGAMTYIGNGPNFMVKSIAENSGPQHSVKMPSFFGYVMYALVLLLPVLVLNWLLFVRS